MPATITLPDGNPLAPLHCRYPSQTTSQPAHLEIDPEDGTAQWGYNAETGNGVPAAVWHGRIYWIPCSNQLSLATITQLSDELRPLVERVIAGGDSEWDGSNLRGSLTDDARDALDEITRTLEDTDLYDAEGGVVDAEDWLYATRAEIVAEACGLDDAGRAALAERLEAEAEGGGYLLDGDVRHIIDRWVEQDRDEEEE